MLGGPLVTIATLGENVTNPWCNDVLECYHAALLNRTTNVGRVRNASVIVTAIK